MHTDSALSTSAPSGNGRVAWRNRPWLSAVATVARLRTAFTPAPKRSTFNRFQHALGRCRPSVVGAVAATVLALGMGSAAPASALAMTENFDALSCGPGIFIPGGTGGLDWGNGGCLNGPNYVNNPSGYAAGATSAPNVALNNAGTPMTLTRNGGGLFSLTAGQFTGVWNDNLNLNIQGFLNSNLVATVPATLSAIQPTLLDLSALANVDRVVFTASGGTPHPAYGTIGATHFALDDLSYILGVSRAITATASPSAGGSVSCTPNLVPDGGTSSCTATANPGYTFTGFAGCTSVSGNSCTLANVTAPAAVTANFAAFTVTGSLPPGTYGTAYSQSLASTGGVDPIGFASNNPPAGITVTPAGLVTAPATLAVGAYTFDVTATDANNAATIATPVTVTIAQAAQTIAFTSANPAGAKLGDSYTVTATGGASGNPVTFSLGANAAPFCTISGNVVSFNATGPCDIIASQLGNANYRDAAPQTQTVAIGKAAQTIAFTSANPAGAKLGDSYTVTATGGASGNPVTFSLGASAAPFCTISGNVVSFNASGPCDIIASQLGNANYLDAAPQTQTVAIGKAAQTIQFTSTPPALPKVGGTYTVTTAAGLSSQPVVVGVSGACSLAGAVVTLNAAGVCTITANQLGDANYLDAAPVTQTVTVAPGASGVNIASTPNPSQPGEAVTFTVSVALDTTKGAAARTKAAAEPTGTVTVTASDTGTALGSAPLVNGAATISTQLLTTAGSHAIVASYSGDANYPATTSLAFTQTVAAAAAPVATPVPTLSEWALIGLSAMLALFGAGRMRRRAA